MKKETIIPWVKTDGGRSEAGFPALPTGGGCVARAIALASYVEYKLVHHSLNAMAFHMNATRKFSVDGGLPKEIYEPYILSLGFEWVSTLKFGSRKRFKVKDLPKEGNLIVSMPWSHHMFAMIDGVVYDLYKPDPNRCVTGYYIKRD